MNIPQSAPPPLHVGDHVTIRGTRILGDVANVNGDRDLQVSIKVTGFRGKSPRSKKARAWRGAWVTCTPDMVAPN